MAESERLKRMIRRISGRTGEITDFNVGGGLHSFLEAIDDELDVADFERDEAVASLLIQSAEGDELDRILNGFRFFRRPPIPSLVLLKFSVNTLASQDIPIPKGAVASTDPDEIVYQSDTTTVEFLEFETYEDGAYIPKGYKTVECYAECTRGGALTNVGEGKINTLVSNLPVDSVVNEYSAAGGMDAWTDDEYRKEWYRALRMMGRCTYNAILAAVPLVSDHIGEKIVFAHLSECDPEPGYNILYLATGDGGLAEGPKAKAQAFCDRYLRGIGTVLAVEPPQEKPLNLACTITYTAGVVNKPRVKAELEKTLINYVRGMNIGGEFAGLAVGAGSVYLNRLITKGLEVPGILDISFDNISENVAIEASWKPWADYGFAIAEAG
ncbi:MAG TPA: baseplate J/gp47 family protein [bacterium]|nr:baseplate J/gp47 family protein [bacterium]